MQYYDWYIYEPILLYTSVLARVHTCQSTFQFWYKILFVIQRRYQFLVQIFWSWFNLDFAWAFIHIESNSKLAICLNSMKSYSQVGL